MGWVWRVRKNAMIKQLNKGIAKLTERYNTVESDATKASIGSKIAKLAALRESLIVTEIVY